MVGTGANSGAAAALPQSVIAWEDELQLLELLAL